MPEQPGSEEVKVKPSKKDKSQGSLNFLQKSRNAFIGAADAVRRVATKGTFVEDGWLGAQIAIGNEVTEAHVFVQERRPGGCSSRAAGSQWRASSTGTEEV
jgi:hypothetical protein